MTSRFCSFTTACTAIFALTAAALAAPPAHAQIVVPGELAGREGANNTTTPISPLPRTHQIIIYDVALNGLAPGSLLTGLSFRLNTPTTGGTPRPLTDISFADYDIFLGQAIQTTTSTTFAENYVPGTRTQVREGALTIAANSMPFTGQPGPQPFGPVIGFNLAPFLYQGGGLVIEISHTGNGVESIGVDSEGGIFGTVSHFASTQGATEATGQTTVPAIQLQFTAAVAPEPGTLALLGLTIGGAGVFTLARRRRS